MLLPFSVLGRTASCMGVHAAGQRQAVRPHSRSLKCVVLQAPVFLVLQRDKQKQTCLVVRASAERQAAQTPYMLGGWQASKQAMAAQASYTEELGSEWSPGCACACGAPGGVPTQTMWNVCEAGAVVPNLAVQHAQTHLPGCACGRGAPGGAPASR